MFAVSCSALITARVTPKTRVSLRKTPGTRPPSTTRLHAFGSWKKAKPEVKEPVLDENGDVVPETGIDFTGLKQLISMGLGTVAGDITEINLDDPVRTVVMELEANNFEDAEGNPLNLRAIDNEGSFFPFTAFRLPVYCP
jgi:hypothetical protein|tara:strand:- start:5768 stop:6187 length:420 start_codon:yes stop_codon:yes gene_type:complete